ncbi:MAG: cupin domain-containing protein [Kofleriaceae bacterium]|nr:cupin domain-containing protein [Myxococcales bacterium]MCB9562242.1 cupin domain-containing protein [Kofleriaceae bacterium]
MPDPVATPSSQPFVTRAAEQPRHGFGPTGGFAFPFAGHAGHPELVVERGGRGSSAPLHRHGWASWEIVLEGRVRFVVDGQEHLLGPGDAIYTPPNVPHTYVIESETAQLVALNEPSSRFEQLQREVAPMMAGPGQPDFAAIGKRAAELGVEVLGPPLTPRL